MFKIELENRDFRKSLYFYIVDAGEKIRAASGCWHYIKSRANIKWTLKKKGQARRATEGYLVTIHENSNKNKTNEKEHTHHGEQQQSTTLIAYS